MIVFVSGGARSGKSRFAEEKAMEICQQSHGGDIQGGLVYVATARKTDGEMTERIRYHQEDRSEIWHTIEEPFDLACIPGLTGIGDIVLVDCLTIWLSNMLYQTSSFISEKMEGSKQLIDVISLIDQFIEGAEEKRQTIIFVSNDVNEGEPALVDPMVREYIYTLEKVHRHIVDRAYSAVQVIAGVPLDWKGEKSL